MTDTSEIAAGAAQAALLIVGTFNQDVAIVRGLHNVNLELVACVAAGLHRGLLGSALSLGPNCRCLDQSDVDAWVRFVVACDDWRSMGVTAFVMTGGAGLGAVHVGMLEALYEIGVTPQLIVGTSVGAINGVYIASRPQTPATAQKLGTSGEG